jgi:hypothetical protein
MPQITDIKANRMTARRTSRRRATMYRARVAASRSYASVRRGRTTSRNVVSLELRIEDQSCFA